MEGGGTESEKGGAEGQEGRRHDLSNIQPIEMHRPTSAIDPEVSFPFLIIVHVRRQGFICVNVPDLYERRTLRTRH